MPDYDQQYSSLTSPEELFVLYQSLQRYVGWKEDDTRRLRALRGVAERLLPDLVEDFYHEIQNHPVAARVFSGSEQIARLKRTLKLWLRELFSGNYDASYVWRHWQAGLRHVQIGLPSVYTHAALARLRQGLMTGLQEIWPGEPTDLLDSFPALNRLLDLDLAIIDWAYHSETVAREQRAARLAEVAEFGRKAFLNFDVGQLMGEACRRTVETLRADVGSVWELNLTGDRLVRSSVFGLKVEEAAIESIEADTATSTGFSLHSSLPIVVEDQSSETTHQFSTFQQTIGSRACLCIAIQGSVRPYGVLQVDFRNPRVFTDADATFLQSISNVLAAVISRQQTEDQARQSERLAAIGQMMTGLAHESRNALQRSQACLEMLTLEVAGQDRAGDLITRIQKAQNHLLHLFEEVRGYASPIHLHRKSCDLRSIWRETWSHLESSHRPKSIELVETCLVDCNCCVDPNSMEQVFRNIFDNAIHASPQGGKIFVQCTQLQLLAEQFLRISIRDQGPGLSVEQRDRMFDPFYTTKTHGTGLGLAIARRIINAHGGNISACSDTTSGAELVLTIPRQPGKHSAGW